MPKSFTVVPAYGRDYTSKAGVAADFNADKDFTISDFFSGQDGRKINKSDAAAAGVTLNIRYKKLTMQVSSTELAKIK